MWAYILRNISKMGLKFQKVENIWSRRHSLECKQTSFKPALVATAPTSNQKPELPSAKSTLVFVISWWESNIIEQLAQKSGIRDHITLSRERPKYPCRPGRAGAVMAGKVIKAEVERRKGFFYFFFSSFVRGIDFSFSFLPQEHWQKEGNVRCSAFWSLKVTWQKGF